MYQAVTDEEIRAFAADEDEKRSAGLNSYEPVSVEEMQKWADEQNKARIERVMNAEERIRLMQENPRLYGDEDIKRFITDVVYPRNANLGSRLMMKHGDLFGHPEWGKPESEKSLPTSDELYGETAFVEVDLGDGVTFKRPASSEELKELRKKEILAIRNPREQTRAIAENIELFR